MCGRSSLLLIAPMGKKRGLWAMAKVPMHGWQVSSRPLRCIQLFSIISPPPPFSCFSSPWVGPQLIIFLVSPHDDEKRQSTNSSSVPHCHTPEDSDPDLSVWPPLPHHLLLESPDTVSPRNRHRRRLFRNGVPLGRQQQHQQLRQRRRRPPDGNAAPSPRMRKGKTMSMVLLDIDPDENLGPRYVAPFSSDLDACDDDDNDEAEYDNGEYVPGEDPSSGVGGERGGEKAATTSRGGRRGVDDGADVDGGASEAGGAGWTEEGGRGRNGNALGNSSDTGSPTRIVGSKPRPPAPPPAAASARGGIAVGGSSRPDDDGPNDGSADAGGRAGMDEGVPSGRSATSSPTSSSGSLTPPPLPCEDNLKCQAYTATHLEALHMHREAGMTTSSKDWQWKPILDVVDGIFGEPGSATSTDTDTFVEVSTSKDDADIIMPNFSSTDDSALVCGVDVVPFRPKDPSTSNKEPIHDQTSSKYVNATNNNNISNTTAEGGRTMTQSSSCASNLSSDVTIKTGNVLLPRSRGMVSASITAPSSSELGNYRRRSASCSVPIGANSTSVRDSGATNDFPIETTTVTKRRSNSDKFKSPDKRPTAITPAQTMKEYVMNDLLNIDSRNQDGSATEDVDENMEEFLRVPPKLEGLMFFSLAVCMDSFLYVWAMLPLKFVWGLVSLACSAYSPRKGIRGVKFHRR